MIPALDLTNLALVIVLTALSFVMLPRRLPLFVVGVYWAEIVLIPFLGDKQIYQAAYVADFLVFAMAIASFEKLAKTCAIVSFLFMVSHTIGYELYELGYGSLCYDLMLTALYLTLIVQFFRKGGRDAIRDVARFIAYTANRYGIRRDSRCSKAVRFHKETK